MFDLRTLQDSTGVAESDEFECTPAHGQMRLEVRRGKISPRARVETPGQMRQTPERIFSALAGLEAVAVSLVCPASAFSRSLSPL